jgi:chemotaxis protein MotB
MVRRFQKQRPEDWPGDQRKDGWQIVYTGFVLIMLCFFVMLTSFASLDPSKITRFVSSFSNAICVLSGGQSIEVGDTMLDSELNLLAKEDLNAMLFEKIRQVAREEGLDQIEIEQIHNGVVLRLKDKLLFDSAEATLSDDAYSRLDKIGRLIEKVGSPVEIQGHTDDRSIQTARYPSNWELSTSRAISVLRYLSQAAGIDARLLSAVGYAEFNPLVPNQNDAGRAMNRRVDFIFNIEEE